MPTRPQPTGGSGFDGGVRKVFSIPMAAITERGQLQSVFVVERGIAHMRLITTGEHSSERTEVLLGLNQDETVIVSPAHALADGSSVEVQP